MKRCGILIGLLLACTALSFSAESPQLINYQGVLRDAAGSPENGPFDMVFRFYDADGGPTCSSGTLLLTDEHLAAGTGAVTVSTGLFNVALGSGNLIPGSVGDLAGMFRKHPAVYLEVAVATEILCPRVRVLSSAYAVNAARESDGDLDLYVNGATGSDTNDGLSSALPKKTIMAAVEAIPSVLNGNVTLLIAPGTYKEEVVLSSRQRNGPYLLLLRQDTANPDTDTPAVIIAPPDPPCPGCLLVGILSTDELVRMVGLQVDGFDFVDEGAGITASGSTNLTLANVVASNNYNGIVSADGHFLELEADCRVENNDIGVLSLDHGSIEINGQIDFCGNTVASLRSERNSWIRIEGDVATCTFCVGDGPLGVFTHSSIESSPCANLPACTVETPGAGLCPGDFP